MEYKKIYNQLIQKRIDNELPQDVYGEVHHIIPKSEGGSNDKSNLVRLSAREHYIAHLLLAKIYDDYKMWCALNFLVHGNKKFYTRVTSRLYDKIKQANSILAKCKTKGMKRPPRSKEWREAIRRAKTGVPSRRKGVSLDKNKGKKWWHKGTENFFGFECPGDGWVLGCYIKPELRANAGKAIVGVVWWNNGEIEVKSRTQPDGFVRGRLKWSEAKKAYHAKKRATSK